MQNLLYVDNDLTKAKSIGPQIIAHVCTETGIWHGSHAEAIARKWPRAKQVYQEGYRNRLRTEFGLGVVQFVNANRQHVNSIVRIANMIAQPDVKRPVRYRAFRKCLIEVRRKAVKIRANVHIPMLRSDQTDSWPDIELILFNTLCTASVTVYVHDPKPSLSEKMFGEVIEKRKKQR